MRKKLLIAIASLGLSVLSVMATTKTKVTAVMYDDSRKEYKIAEDGSAEFQEKRLVIKTSKNAETVSLPITEIKKLMMETVDESSIAKNVSDENTLNVYPNPAQELVFVKGLNGREEISIYSICGTLVKKVYVEDSEPIDISNLNSGLYIMRAGTKTTKIYKK